MNFKERRDVKAEVSFTGGEPLIYVTPIALDKMAWYVQGCDKEIGWLGQVERMDNIFLIHDAFLFKQEVHATTCEINPEGLADFVTELFTTNPENAMEIVNNLRLWGHSHVNMTVSPSGQDETQVNVFKDANPWFIRVIANKAGEMEFSIFDFEQGIKFKNVKWMEYRTNQVALEETIKAEIKEKVTTKTYSGNTSYKAGRVWNSKTYKWENDTPKNTNVVNYAEEKYGNPRRSSCDLDEGYYNLDGDGDIQSNKLFAKINDGWQEVTRDAKGEIPEDFIIDTFTTGELGSIAMCKTLTEVIELLLELDFVNEYKYLDAMKIWNTAKEVYPK